MDTDRKGMDTDDVVLAREAFGSSVFIRGYPVFIPFQTCGLRVCFNESPSRLGNLDQRLAEVIAAHHGDERGRRVLESLGDGFRVDELALFDPAGHAPDGFGIAVAPVLGLEALKANAV